MLFPAAGSFAPGGAQNVDIAERIETWLAATKALPGAAPTDFINIVGGSISPVAAFTAVDVEGGSGGGLDTDDLDQINPVNLPDGAIICIRPRATGRTIVLRHARGGAGQVFTPDGQSYVMTDSSQHWIGVLAPDRLSWTEITRSWGDQYAAQRTALGLKDPATWDAATDAEMRAGTADDKLMTPQRVAAALGDVNLAFINRPFQTVFNIGDQLLILRQTSAAPTFAIQRIGLSVLLGNSLSKLYQSGEIAIANGGGGTIASHGLDGEPTSIEIFIRCKISEGSYPVGIIQRYHGERFVVAPNAVGAFYRFANESQPITLRNLTTGAQFDATNANWRMIVRMRR